MTAQGLEVFDQSVHLTHEWINKLAERLDWPSKRSALRLMRGVLDRIHDHLLVEEVAQLSSQLPVMIRGFFFEGWVPKDSPIKERHGERFIAFIGYQCVFDLLNARVSRGEVEDVRANLPQDLRDLWSAP